MNENFCQFSIKKVAEIITDNSEEKEGREAIASYADNLITTAAIVSSMSKKELSENRELIITKLQQASSLILTILNLYSDEYNIVQELCRERDKLNNCLRKAGWNITIVDEGKEQQYLYSKNKGEN